MHQGGVDNHAYMNLCNVLDRLTYCCVMWSYGLLHFSKVVVLPSVLSLSIHRESVPGTVQRGSHVML